MTFTRLAAVGDAGPGGWQKSWGGSAPALTPVARLHWLRQPHPLLNVAGSGGRGLAAHASGVHGLGGNEVQVLVVGDLI